MNNIILSDGAPKPIGPYSQAILTDGTLYCSGQIAIDPQSNEFLGGDIILQTERVCQNIKAVLKAAALDFDSVVKTTCYITNPDDFASFNEIYGKYFVSNPARSTVIVKALPKNALVEVEVTAVKSS